MVSRLADEILWMILAPCLAISDDDFECEDLSTFGSNDNVSSSAAYLLVCKRWMRIATPLLYETVVLRSTGQTHSLADTLKRNPPFGLHVKKIRLETAPSRLLDVFKRCTNLQSLFFVLDDISTTDNSYSLCRSLSVINPTKVHLKEDERAQFDPDNANKRKIFLALCNSIPGWTKLREFHFPYPRKMPDFGQIHHINGRRLLLAKTLKDSPSMEVIRSRTPSEWDSVWSNLASNKRINFYFDVNHEENPLYLHFQSAMDGDPELKRAISFEHKSPTYSLSRASMEPLLRDPSFSPLALTDSATSDMIWSRIFCFALFEACPEDNDFADIVQQHLIMIVYPMTRRRNDISLVCRDWHRLIQRIFRHSPFVTSVSGLEGLADNLIRDPAVGSQIHVLSLQLSLSEIEQLGERYYSALDVIFRGLPRLRYLLNFKASSISWELFEALSATAGNTLVKILNLNVTPRKDGDATSEVFSHLQSLEKLEVSSLPAFRKGGVYAKDCLAAIKQLAFGVKTSAEPEYFATLRLPLLRTVRFFKAMGPELRFLESCGQSIRCLDIYVPPMGDRFGDGDVDLLSHCPNLETLILRNESRLFCPKFLGNSAGNNTLKEISISAWMGGYYYDSKSSKTQERFFDKIRVSRFPLLTKIKFLSYAWPIRHRDIERTYLVKKASELIRHWNVEIVDESGKTFRPRVGLNVAAATGRRR